MGSKSTNTSFQQALKQAGQMIGEAPLDQSEPDKLLGSPTPLIRDFPELLKDKRLAQAIYSEICREAELDPSEKILRQDWQGLFGNWADLEEFVALYLTLAYQPQGQYDPDEILQQAIATVIARIKYLSKLMVADAKTASERAWNLPTAAETGKTEEIRRWETKRQNVPVKRGRRSLSTGALAHSQDKIRKDYKAIMPILDPAYRKENPTNRMVAISDALERLGVEDHGSEITDEVREEARTSQSAAQRVLAKKYSLSISTVKSRLARH